MHISGVVRKPIEWSFHAALSYANPFQDITLDVSISDDNGTKWIVPAFWAGGNEFRVRFSAPHTGNYTYESTCNSHHDSGLHAQTGTLHISEYTGSNPLYIHGHIGVTPNGRYFQHEDGTPFPWLGDTWWMMYTSRLQYPEEFNRLVQDRVDKGFTVIQMVNGLFPDMPPYDRRGENEAGYSWMPDWSQINPAYFDLADQKLEGLVDAGLVPCMTGAWGYYRRFMDLEQIKQHYRYMIARYGAYPVIWNLAGEVSMPWYQDFGRMPYGCYGSDWSDVLSYIKEIDPYHHLISTHEPTYASALNTLDNPEELDFLMWQGTHADIRDEIYLGTQMTKQFYEVQPPRPVVSSEASYEGMLGGNGPDVQRMIFWHAVLNGAAGHTYGASGLWNFNTKEEPYGASPGGITWSEDIWRDSCLLPGATQIGFSRKFLNRYEWWRLVPAEDKAEDHPKIEKFRRSVAAEIPGELIIYYFNVPYGRDALQEARIFNLSADDIYQVTVFDPIYDRTHDLGQMKASADRILTVSVPTVHDWVVVLTKIHEI